MKLQLKTLGITVGIFSAGITFFVGLVNTIFPPYGTAFLKVLESVFPGFTYGKWGFLSILVATGYALVDGFIVGIIFAWIYNLFAKE